MKRRSRAGGEPAKARRRKAVTLKHRNAPKVTRSRPSSVGGIDKKIALLTRERDEALEQLTATSEVLQVISSFPDNLLPVFEAILEKAVHICDAKFGYIYRGDGDAFDLVATYNVPPAFASARRGLRIRPKPGMPLMRMLATKATVHVADVAAEPMYTEERDPAHVAAVELGGVRTLLAVPMLKESELIGAFAIYRQEVRPFTDKQIALVSNFAAQAVIAIENTRLLNELRESLQQQTATADVLRVISSSPGDLQPVFEAMLENAVRICDAKFGNIYRWDGEVLRILASLNTPPALAEARRHSAVRPTSQVRRMVETHVADLAADPGYIERRFPAIVDAVELGGVRTFLTVPMVKENELVGSFSLYRQEVRPFTDKQIALVTNFAAQAVIAIENARLLNELRQRTDELSRSVGELRGSVPGSELDARS
jgi:GAF domain-containing protein